MTKPHRAAPDVLDLLEQFGATVTVHRSHPIYRRGDPTELCWRIVYGCARTVTLMEDGRRQIDEFLWPGDLLGMDGLGEHDVDAEAVTAVTLRRYSRRMVEALAQSHVELALRLRTMAAARLRDARRQMILLGRMTAIGTASLLLAPRDRVMPARPIWRGHLRLALVSCPVALWNAKHERNAIRFNQINPKTGHRIRMMTFDAETDEEVQRRDLVKGYEFRKDQYLLLTDEDLDSVKVESSSVMNIEKFVEVDSIDPIYYASSYYLAPDGDAGHDVYAVLCKAIAETGRVAVARVVIGQRERSIALRSMPGGLVAHTLDEQRDINDARSILGDAAEIKTDPEVVALAKQLIDRQTTRYDPSDLEDRYETRVRAMIDAKLKGEGIDLSEPVEPDRSNVVDLMTALKKSLGQEAAATKKSATPQPPAPAKPKRAAAAQAAMPGRKRA